VIYHQFTTFMAQQGPWERQPRIAVAFSGGSDSVLLLQCAVRWATARQGHVVALHVNHGMRAEAAEEAKRVGRWCAHNNIEYAVLWPPSYTPTSQKYARLLRYDVMGRWCRQHRYYHLLVAHHADDQNETVVMRCLHQSGVQGLCGMRPVMHTSWGRIVRPLLGHHIGVHRTYAVVNDCSNVNHRYERVRVRAKLLESSELRHLSVWIQKSAKELDAIQKRKMSYFLARYVRCYAQGYCTFSGDIWKLPYDITLLILERIAMVVSGSVYPMRRDVCVRLYGRLLHLRPHQATTAGGCQVHRTTRGYCCVREWKRVESMTIPARDNGWFDGRWWIHNPSQSPITVFAYAQQHPCHHILYASLPVFLEKSSVKEVSLVPYRGEVNGYFKPRTPLIGQRM